MTAVCDDIRSKLIDILSSNNITPRGIQREAINLGLLEGKNLLVCSPTGSGKTLIGEMALLRSVLMGKKGLYLVPLRALAIQVFDNLRQRYARYKIAFGISTGDFQSDGEELDVCDIIVSTFERADSLLRRNTSWFLELGTVVIDEIQTLSEPQRGPRLESFLIRITQKLSALQLIGLSATIAAPEELAEWLNCRLLQSDERPVPLHYSIIPTRNRFKTLRNIVMSTIQGDGQVIVFVRTRRDAETYSSRLSTEVVRQLTSSERKELELELNSVENWDIDISKELRAVLYNGVAFHHAGLGLPARNLVERLFKAGLLRVVCATSTLAAGIDFPARTVVITNARSPQDFRLLLDSNQIHQMLGRAGRPGYDTIGFGVILAGSKGEAEIMQRKYFDSFQEPESEKIALFPKYTKVRSLLNNPESLTEQLLVAFDLFGETTIKNVQEEFFDKSFLVFCGVRNNRSPMRLLNLEKVTTESAIECHGLSGTIRAAREGALSRVEIREQNEQIIGGIVRGYDGGQYSCRFSSRTTADGLIEGPMCSCGEPVTPDGILCPHLVSLGFAAKKKLGSLADFVIPLSLGETSPLSLLKRLGLIEGARENRFRPTRLGRLVCKLYLRIPTFREMYPLLPTVKDSTALLWLLRHLVSLETGSDVSDSFEELIAGVASTSLPIVELARKIELSSGDAIAFLETACWLLNTVVAIAEYGGLKTLAELAGTLLGSLETRLERNELNDRSVD